MSELIEYGIFINVGASTYQTVKAETPEEAIENAEWGASICHHCSNSVEIHDGEDFEVTLDGEVVLKQCLTDDIEKSLQQRLEAAEIKIESLKGDVKSAGVNAQKDLHKHKTDLQSDAVNKMIESLRNSYQLRRPINDWIDDYIQALTASKEG